MQRFFCLSVRLVGRETSSDMPKRLYGKKDVSECAEKPKKKKTRNEDLAGEASANVEESLVRIIFK